MRGFLVTAMLVSALVVNAQAPDFKTLQALKPREIGPAGTSGRVTSIAVVRKQPNVMYAGTASGGLWKSDNGGIAWRPVFDTMDVGSIGAVAVLQSNPSVVWAGTGEGNPRNSHNSGRGIYRSLDGGRSWKKMGLEQTRTIHRIITVDANPDVVYVAAMGSVWGPSEERGVYKTTDGGVTWQRVLFTNNLSGCAELVADPTNPNKLFAAMWQYQRKPYAFNSGGPGSGLFMTVDGGKTWSRQGVNEGLPAGILGRIGIAVSAADPMQVYAIVESKTLDMYKSNDGGYRWQKVANHGNMGNRPFYYNEIYSDPKNPNRLYSLWSQVSRSENGGRDWETLLDWGHVHPDHHAFYIHPDNPDFLMNGNDGGLNISYDGGKTWRYAANLPVGQFYHVNVDNELPYNVYGGLQDNGSWKGPGYTWTEGGIRNSDWKELLFGDGFDVVPLDGNRGYAMWQGGNVYFYNLITGRSQAVKPVHPSGTYLRFNWNAGIAKHPGKTNSLYMGSQFLHRSDDNGMTWRIISPDLSTNDTAKLHQAQSGGLTIDATNAENYCTIITIVPASSDTSVIWVGTDDGNVQLTRDGGKTWTLLNPKIAGLPKNAWIPNICVSKTNAGEAWLVANNYRQNDWEPYLFHTTDFGATWKRMADGNKVHGHCLSVWADSKVPNLVFLGTDHGLFISFDAGNTWNKWSNGIPSCPVQDMAFQERENDLVLATFGRGIFVFDDITPFRLFASGTEPLKHDLKIMHATDAVLAAYTRPSGERFGADGFYEGENKPYGSTITLYTKGTRNNKTGKWEKTKFTGEVYNEAGQKIRTHKFDFDSAGIYRFQWRLIADGFHYPGYRTPEPDETLPAGRSVPPGRYKLLIKTGNYKDSQWIEVKSNPAETYNAVAEAAKTALYNRLKTVTNRAFKAFEGLKQAEESIKMIEMASFLSDSAGKKLTEAAKPLKDSIKKLEELFMPARDVTYYDDVTQRLNDLLGAASGLIDSDMAPAGNAETALANAEREAAAVIARVNWFFDHSWSTFRAGTEKEKVKLFQNAGGY